MKNNVWNKKIPTLLGLAFIVLGIATTTYLVNTGVITIGQAAPGQIPKDIRITNVSDTSFSVSYITESETTGTVAYGLDQNYGSVVLDNRDQQANKPLNYKVHYITVKNLHPQTTYAFAIVSGNNTYIQDNTSFTITTATSLSTPSTQQIIRGSVTLPDGATPKEAIIYANAQGAQTISSLVNPDGTYSISLQTLRTENLASYISLSSDKSIQMLIVDPTHKSNISFMPSQTSSIPPIILSKDYDFSVSQSPAETPITQYGFPILTATSSGSNTTQILTPKENETFSDQQPLFKGTASPGATIKVTIESEEKIEQEIKADNKGNWTFRPNQNLSPGTHTITITAPDPFGVLRTITQSFTVFAQGSQVNQSATPSATPTLTNTPTLTQSGPTPTSTPVPTAILSPSPTNPFLSPTPTTIVNLPTPPAPPGSQTTTIGITGIAVLLLGIILFLISKGTIPFP